MLVEAVKGGSGGGGAQGDTDLGTIQVRLRPVVTTSAGTATYVENAAGVTVDPGLTLTSVRLVAGSLRERRCTVRLNNVVSFSRTREQAGCFGDWLLRVQVPLCKLLLWPGLLDTASLQGESEVIALGGDYDVEASYA